MMADCRKRPGSRPPETLGENLVSVSQSTEANDIQTPEHSVADKCSKLNTIHMWKSVASQTSVHSTTRLSGFMNGAKSGGCWRTAPAILGYALNFFTPFLSGNENANR
jgi:hypothetical protein